jgi:hypothetical protein
VPNPEELAALRRSLAGGVGAARAVARWRTEVPIRAYRDIQHELELMDHDIDSALHATRHTTDSVWHDVRDGVASVAQSIDHVTDKLLHR